MYTEVYPQKHTDDTSRNTHIHRHIHRGYTDLQALIKAQCIDMYKEPHSTVYIYIYDNS